MGMLVDGQWQIQPATADADGGAFVRESAGFRSWVEPDAAAVFPAATGRYHLVVSLACPWAHRTLIMRRLKGLDKYIGVSVMDPIMGEHGWSFSPASDPEPLYGLDHLYELYQRAAPDYTGKVTTPTLWDRGHETIVSNESADILRMFNQAFDVFAEQPARDYYPQALRAAIDSVNERVYDSVNNGVYRAGFATIQSVYENAYADVFDTLDWLDQHLATQRYLAGDQITEADWRLFVTLVRFDAVYYGHFKCNRQRIADFAHLSGYLRELYQVDGVAETVDMQHIKTHYYGSHPGVNPTGIVPVGPVLDFLSPPGRDSL